MGVRSALLVRMAFARTCPDPIGTRSGHPGGLFRGVPDGFTQRRASQTPGNQNPRRISAHLLLFFLALLINQEYDNGLRNIGTEGATLREQISSHHA